MCDTAYEHCFDLSDVCKGNMYVGEKGRVQIKGSLKNNLGNGVLVFWAANPPDYMTNFSGSGLPFPNTTVAFENTPNKGKVPYKNGKFSFYIHFPNSYYSDMGNILHKPQIFFQIDAKPQIYSINIGNGVPYRSLTYPGDRVSPMFYQNEHLFDPLATEETYLRKRGYPSKNKMPSDFWGFA